MAEISRRRGLKRGLKNECVWVVGQKTETTSKPSPEIRSRRNRLPRRAVVVVLSDIGLSPRMQYHALSLAHQASLRVDVVCYGGTDPHSALMENPSIRLYKMGMVPNLYSPRFPCRMKRILKVIFQFFVLLYFILFKVPTPDVFIVQGPPLPALLAIRWISWFKNSTLIVDWHDVGQNQFRLRHKRNSTLVKIYNWFEKCLKRMADGVLCSTKFVQKELAQNFGIRGEVLYDRSHDFFYPATLKEKHQLFLRLKEDLGDPHSIHHYMTNGEIHTSDSGEDQYSNNTMLTIQAGCNFFEKLDRPAIIVTGISWTREKNFSKLLEAAVLYDRHVALTLNSDGLAKDACLYGSIRSTKKHFYPKLLFVVIVRGPKRRKFEEVIKKSHLKFVAFRTVWLPAEDYRVLLGSADLGVCLHTSTSGLDLPVTIADMFGCGLPVCAASFPCIEELIDVGQNGLTFSSPSDLADGLLALFRGFPDHCDALKLMRVRALTKASSTKWTDEWVKYAKPLIEQVVLQGSLGCMVLNALKRAVWILFCIIFGAWIGSFI